MSEFKTIPIKEIRPDQNQPRKFYDESAMAELTSSIKEKGVLQPILIRPNGKGYILVCGERRFRASQAAGLSDIPAVIREMSDDEALELQIIENLQRKDVHPMEEAVAFKSLLENKSRILTIEEVAAKVGKSVYYVRQRMKLNSLTPGWQKVFYAHRIETAEALAVGQLSEKDQELLFKQRVHTGWEKNPNMQITIADWDITRMQRKLNGAPFDRKDETLNPKMGACTTCPFNTAVSSLFPEDAKEPRCNNGECFEVKCSVAFERKLATVKDDPAVILVDNEYGGSKGVKAVESLRKEGHKVYTRGWDGECDQVFSPKKEDIDAGKYLKAFVVNGSETGQFIYVKLNKKSSGSGSSKAASEKIKEGKASPAMIEEEIKRIQDREKRNKELDQVKVHKQILTATEKHEAFKKPVLKMQQIDRAILMYILLNEVGGANGYGSVNVNKLVGIPDKPYGGEKYHFDYFEKLAKLTDDQLALIIRAIIHKKYSNAEVVQSINASQTPMFYIAQYLGVDIKSLQKAQDEVAAKRSEKVKARIAALNKTKAELNGKKNPPKKTAAKKATAKKTSNTKSKK